MLADRESGLPSREESTMLAKRLEISAERFFSDFALAWFALDWIKPMSAWVRSVSTVTRPVFAADLYQASSLVSDRMGLASTRATLAVGAPSSDFIQIGRASC